MDENLVSAIVPLYNCADRITVCIGSILAQTHKNIEVIVIDDGSTDNSYDVVASMADPRIRLYTQENHGVSYTRNRGMDLAKGEWLTFVDSDDYIEANMFEHMLNINEIDKFDIISAGIDTRSETGAIISNNCTCEEAVLSRNKALEYLMLGLADRPGAFGESLHLIYSKLYRHSFLDTTRIKFEDSLSFAEDRVFFISCLYKLDYIYAISRPFYHHVRRNNSLSSVKTEKDMMRFIDGLHTTWNLLTQYVKTNPDELGKACAGFLAHDFNRFLSRSARTHISNERIKEISLQISSHKDIIDFACKHGADSFMDKLSLMILRCRSPWLNNLVIKGFRLFCRY